MTPMFLLTLISHFTGVGGDFPHLTDFCTSEYVVIFCRKRYENLFDAICPLTEKEMTLLNTYHAVDMLSGGKNNRDSPLC